MGWCCSEVRSAFVYEAVDPVGSVAELLARWQYDVDSYAEGRDWEGADARVIDVRFTDLVTDPLETVARVYDELGLALTAQALGAMARHLETDHHASAPKRAYTLAEYEIGRAHV